MNEINTIISELFNARWVGESTLKNIDAMREQLYKNMLDQINGWRSGHTAYSIMRDGGFIIDAKHQNGKAKKATVLGLVFMKSMEK